MSEPAFGAPWQARAFAIVRMLQDSGVVTAREWADALGTAIRRAQAAGDADGGAAYYDYWLDALERLVVQKDMASAQTLSRYQAAWRQAATRTPHGQSIALDTRDFQD